MSTTNTSTAQTGPSLPDLLAAKMAAGVESSAPEWILMAPDGRTWITSDVTQLFAVLAPHHPLLKRG